MGEINVTHRCSDAECPYFRQPTTSGCLCHKSERTMLEEAAEAQLAALKALVAVADGFGAIDWHDDVELLDAARAAIAKSEGC